MKRMNAREARQRFAELLDSAQAGRWIAITKRGRTVAVIGPTALDAAPPLPDLTAFRKSLKLTGKPMSQTVVEMRRQDRY